MPIYEYACPKCRVVFSFLSKKVNPPGSPTCPKCSHKKLQKQMSRFAMVHRTNDEAPGDPSEAGQRMPDLDDPKIARAMAEMEREALGMDENNPRHMAHLLKKMKGILPPDAVPKEFDQAVKRLEAGEDPEKIEEEMGPLFDEMMGGKPGARSSGHYSHDPGLYDF